MYVLKGVNARTAWQYHVLLEHMQIKQVRRIA